LGRYIRTHLPMGRKPKSWDSLVEYDTNGGCHLWSGHLSTDGYPLYKRRLATRKVLEDSGVEPGDWLACHTCHVRACVRREHLYAGTPLSNMQDAQKRGTFENLHKGRDAYWEKNRITQVQTFMPYPNFACSAMVLDRARLNKQVLEARQILTAIRNGGGWKNHPAVKMWRGYEPALRFYHDVMQREWVRRGYVTTIEPFSPALSDIVMPPWVGGEAFHASHRAALLLKDPTHYGDFGWTETPANAYVWPVS
jgi:hypothetical protein